MAFNPALPTVGFAKADSLAIVWGTDWASVGSAAGYIVKSIRDTERNEEIKIENGTGLTAEFILLLDGRDIEITVVDDTTITPPASGGWGTLIDPLSEGTTVVACFLTHKTYSGNRKVEGERTFSAKQFTLFTV